MISALLDWIFPPKCPFCNNVFESSVICPQCLKDLPWIPTAQVVLTIDSLLCASPLWYEEPVRSSIHRFKFKGGRFLAPQFATLMAECAAAEFSGAFDTVTWAPVSRKRLRKRGYDQSELLANEMCKLWSTTPQRLLVKHTHTRAQSSLADGAARHGNVAGVYRIAPNAQVLGQRILLVDDICTTGSTLNECARILLLGGAKEVMCVTLAKTLR